MFLDDLKSRPLYARATKDNVASLRVLEKCGFTICGDDKAFANARGEEIEEAILELRCHFDPQVVEAFMACQAQFRAVADQMSPDGGS